MEPSKRFDSDADLTIFNIYKGDKVRKVIFYRLNQTLLGEIVCANDFALENVIYVDLPVVQELRQRLSFEPPVDQLAYADQGQ